MNVTQFLVFYGFCVSGAAFAAPPPTVSPEASSLARSVQAAQQQLVERRASREQLERALSEQEAGSQRASESLRERDQAITELRRQLSELQARHAADSP
jgi:septal ring factor EnvC (AmiA/AmiB activator)